MQSLVKANNQFAVDLYARLRDKPGNLFFSPESLSTALAMTYAGARGETATQMARVLHFDLPRDQLNQAFQQLLARAATGDKPAAYLLSTANRLWIQQGYQLNDSFVNETREFYNAGLAELDFVRQTESSRQAINRWVEDQTADKIKNLIPESALTSLTRLVLTNAIYFKGDWQLPFPANQTRDHTFHLSPSQTTKVPLMSHEADYQLHAAEGLKVLSLPYAGGDLSMIVLLPDDLDGLQKLESDLTSEKLEGWVKGLRRQKVSVFLPRFKMSSEFSLGETLSAMGMPLLFDEERADLSGIATQDRLHVSAVIHKAFVDVNEEGTEAAAATGIVIGVRSAAFPAPPVIFRADHPFLFLIRENQTGRILFLGRVANPGS